MPGLNFEGAYQKQAVRNSENIEQSERSLAAQSDRHIMQDKHLGNNEHANFHFKVLRSSEVDVIPTA